MASALPTPLECSCTTPDNGCCQDSIVEITQTTAGNLPDCIGDPNTQGITPSDTTTWNLLVEKIAADDSTFKKLWFWNPDKNLWE